MLYSFYRDCRRGIVPQTLNSGIPCRFISSLIDSLKSEYVLSCRQRNVRDGESPALKEDLVPVHGQSTRIPADGSADDGSIPFR